MDLKHFRLIKTIVEEGSIANSSEKLYLTQSALSHQLKDIESELGFKIFFRSRNDWRLTKQGEELYQMAKKLFKTIDEGLGKIQHINAGNKGVVRIGTECYSFYQGLPRFIQKMAILYPDIYVDLVIDATHDPVAKLVSNEIDMAITTEAPSSDQLSSVDFYQDEVVCLMNKENHLALESHLQPHHFTEVPLLIHSYPLDSVAVYSQYLKPNGIIPPKITAIPFLSILIEMVEVNMGVACLPLDILPSFSLSKQIMTKKIGKKGIMRTHNLVYRNSDRDKKYMKDFICNIQEEFDYRS